MKTLSIHVTVSLPGDGHGKTPGFLSDSNLSFSHHLTNKGVPRVPKVLRISFRGISVGTFPLLEGQTLLPREKAWREKNLHDALSSRQVKKEHFALYPHLLCENTAERLWIKASGGFESQILTGRVISRRNAFPRVHFTGLVKLQN